MSTPTQEDIDAAKRYYSGAFLCTAVLAEAFHQHAVRAAERMRTACLAEATARREMAELHMARAKAESPGSVTIQNMNAMATACEHIEERIRALDPSTILEGSNDG